MKRICEICKDKDSCSYIKKGNESNCPDMQIYTQGYEDATEKSWNFINNNLINYFSQQSLKEEVRKRFVKTVIFDNDTITFPLKGMSDDEIELMDALSKQWRKNNETED